MPDCSEKNEYEGACVQDFLPLAGALGDVLCIQALKAMKKMNGSM